jgi:hypothetical protein
MTCSPPDGDLRAAVEVWPPRWIEVSENKRKLRHNIRILLTTKKRDGSFRPQSETGTQAMSYIGLNIAKQILRIFYCPGFNLKAPANGIMLLINWMAALLNRPPLPV